jgi:glucose-1-phosphate cytidylyltransferase
LKGLIFAGGLGTRIRSLQPGVPKPLIRVGRLPVLAHVITIYARNGVRDIVVLGGYKVEAVREFLGGYAAAEPLPREGAWRFHDVRFELAPPCDVTLLDTGAETDTGGRLFLARDLVAGERFCLTYGDSLVDFDLERSVGVLEKEKALGVLCAYKLPFSYGAVSLEGSRVKGFAEKKLDIHVNAGFYVLEPPVLGHVTRTECSFEREVLPALAAQGGLAADQGVRFWHPMDTPADHAELTAIHDQAYPDVPWLRK